MGRKVKHIPQRTCIGCKQVLPKRSLIRIVRTADGVKVDPTGKIPGRGAYIHDVEDCWKKGLKGTLAHALKTEISIEDQEYLTSYITTFKEDHPQPATP